jgi:hypothetical protein
MPTHAQADADTMVADDSAHSKTNGERALHEARERLNGRSLVVSIPQGQAARFYPEAFEDVVAAAARRGATHVTVTLPYEYTDFLPDNDDPYACWCNTFSLFRIFPPKALQPWIPLGEAKRLQAILAAQLEIADKYGMKAVAGSPEPLWLPEGVYEAHPTWRGPQVELGRIAKRPYFAPAVDDPEVLQLYREAMFELASTFPQLDQFDWMGNDSGSGFSWASNLYPGMNGPIRHRHNDGGARVVNWLKAMQDGAAEAGVHVRLHAWFHGMTPEFKASAVAKLRPGLFVAWSGVEGEHWGGPGAGMPGGIWSTFYPVLGMGSGLDFVGGLQNIYANAGGDNLRCSLNVDSHSLPLAEVLMDSFFENPGTGMLHCLETTLRAAERITGSEAGAEKLVSVWQSLGTVQAILEKVQQKGFGLVMPFCGVSMRWFTRPLVPEPEKLTDDEKAHYRDHLLSVDSEEELANYCRVLGKPVFRGEGVTWMARWALHDVANRLDALRSTVASLADDAPRLGTRMLKLFAARLGAAACLARTARNTIMYQYALDTAHQPQFGPNAMDYDDNIMYDQRALTMRKIAREEADNVIDLIRLIEGAADLGWVLDRAVKPEEESVFLLGPDLVGDLKKKHAIMMAHWHDYERLYPATKVYDFEPEPLGNIAPPDARL